MRRKYTHLLFDHDGVLVDTEPLYYRATEQVLDNIGIELDLAQYLKWMAVGENAWQLARRAEHSEEQIDHYRTQRNRIYQQFLIEQDIEIPGVVDLLRKLKRRFSLAIVTTARRADFNLIHAERDIVAQVEFVLAREDYVLSKPQPDPYLLALDRFGINADQALVIEDSQRGLMAAYAAGIDCAVVHNAFTATQNFDKATYRLADLRQLEQVLAS